MQTFTQRFTVLLTAALLALTTAITGCAALDLGRPDALPTIGVDVDWPSADSSLATLSGAAPEVNHPNCRPRPTASTAKVITALTVLAKHPLEAGQPGPALTLDAGDVERYELTVAAGGSALLVHEGMAMTQYAMLEAMLLPSANNVADSLALWSFGSMDAYREAATAFVRSLGMGRTTIGSDASGFSPSTTSTAGDLALLARAAMNEPVIAEIVAQSSAVIDGYGLVQNTNTLLGTSGIVGLKTGTSPQAGGVFMFAAQLVLNGDPTLVVGAVMGSGDSSSAAMEAARKLVESITRSPASATSAAAAALSGGPR